MNIHSRDLCDIMKSTRTELKVVDSDELKGADIQPAVGRPTRAEACRQLLLIGLWTLSRD